MARSKTRHFLTKRDLDILLFIWKYKVVNTALIYHKFFYKNKSASAYYILKKLQKHSYINTRGNREGKKPVWILERKGFEAIRNELPELRNLGFQSESIDHDLICSYMQLGNYLKKEPEDLAITTEQMLRNYHLEFIPSYIPNTNSHRPDGYWYFKNGKSIKLMSLEVELNQKSTGFYEGYSSFYESFPSNSRVLWVVKTKKQGKKIFETMYEYEPDYIIHNFVLLKDIYSHGWQAKFFAGINQNETVLNLFEENLLHKPFKSHLSLFNTFMDDRRLSYEIHSENKLRRKIKKQQLYGGTM